MGRERERENRKREKEKRNYTILKLPTKKHLTLNISTIHHASYRSKEIEREDREEREVEREKSRLLQCPCIAPSRFSEELSLFKLLARAWLLLSPAGLLLWR